eukprot:scaffold935_cov196-Alexandrium_tamarense.AAC.4
MGNLPNFGILAPFHLELFAKSQAKSSRVSTPRTSRNYDTISKNNTRPSTYHIRREIDSRCRHTESLTGGLGAVGLCTSRLRLCLSPTPPNSFKRSLLPLVLTVYNSSHPSALDAGRIGWVLCHLLHAWCIPTPRAV